MPSDASITECIRRALEEVDAGRAPDLDAICGGRSDAIAEVRDALALADDAARLLVDGAPTDPWIGRSLQQRYRLLAWIGGGAMGAVYRGRDETLHRDVAVKLLRACAGGADGRESFERRFVREAETLAALRHPHIVPIHDRGVADDGTAFLVMELVPGVTLARLIESARDVEPRGAVWQVGHGWCDALPSTAWVDEQFLRCLVRWIAEVAEALVVAHSSGIHHRDVKPSNMMVTPTGQAMLMDFGLARRTGDAPLTRSGAVMGTPGYMAPELLRAGTADPVRVDVYGLAATLYHALALEPPYRGDALQILEAMGRRDPVPLATLHPGLPRDLLAIVERGMDPNPRRRYPSMAGFAADLRSFLGHRPVTARPLTAVQRLWRRVRRAPAVTAAIVALAALLCVSTVLGIEWLEAAARARWAMKADLVARLPALLAIEGDPEQRLLAPLSEFDDVLAHLDRILEIDPEDAAIRLWRAAVRLDRGVEGDHAAAALDLAAIAQFAATPYLRQVATRYATAGAGRRGALAVELQGLPAPATPADCFVAGFHELRRREPGFAPRALEHLTKAAAHDLAARDLRLLAVLAVADSAPEPQRSQQYRHARDEALALETIYGHPTARTRAVVGAALLGQQLDVEAEQALRESLALRAGRHGPMQNLGLALLRQGRTDEAIQILEEAHAARPHAWHPLHTLARCHVAKGEFARALEVTGRIRKQSLRDCPWRKPDLQGWIHCRAALNAHRNGDVPTRDAAVARSIECYEAALGMVSSENTANYLRAAQSVPRALQLEPEQGFARALDALVLGPLQPDRVVNACLLFPESLTAPACVKLREYLRAVAQTLAPESSALLAAVDR
jgi:tetratricopeptide (TPR) repeat protein